MASKKKRAPSEKQVDFDLSIIEELGGDKHDLELLQDVVDEDIESLEGFDNDMDVEPVKKDELRDFIKNLGIKKYRDNIQDKDERETKTLPETNKEKKEEKKKKKQSDDVNTRPVLKKKERNKYKTLADNAEPSMSTKASQPRGLHGHVLMYKPRTYLLVRHGQQWRDKEDALPVLGKDSGMDQDLERQMENFASKLLEDEVKIHNKQWESNKKSEATWIKTVLVSGTLSDKIAALTLLVQESPVHCLHSLDSLVAMAKKKGMRECMMAADSLRELFTSHLLPENRKLRQFDQFDLVAMEATSGGNRDTVDRKLLLSCFESQLRQKYIDFIKALDMMSKDKIPAAKQKALSTVFELLVERPEQEQLLLSMLVNKLGDPDYKLAAKTTHLLSRLVDKHPNMNAVVVGEVERFLYRPNVSQRAQYYGICFLNQLLLSHDESQLAVKLIRLYFSFFKLFVKKGQVDSKMMSALLTGVNRAYPYAKDEAKFITEQMDTLYKIVHIVNFNTSLQALMLLYQVMDSSEGISDRYYSALYKKLIDPALRTSARQSLFLNLLFKSMKKDVAERRVKAFIKRLLQICPFHTPHFTCAALVLLGEVIKSQPHAILTKHRTLGYTDDDDDDEEEHFTDLPAPGESKSSNNTSSDSQTDGTEESEDVKPNIEDIKPTIVKSSWVHKSIGRERSMFYDPFIRNPLHCRAEQECMWELEKLAAHFHPSVALFAKTLLKGQPITYGGDPLHDFTTIRFLDRFVYKNPKQQDSLPENAGMLSKTQPKRRDPLRGAKKFAVNSKKYLSKNESEIPVEEKFFHKYFTQKEAMSKKVKVVDNSDDEGSVCDDDFDAYLDKYEGNLEGGDNVTFDFSDVDFAGAMGKKPKKKKKKEISDEEEEEEDDMDNLSDEEMDFENDEDFQAAFKDFDVGDDDEDDDDDDDANDGDGDDDDDDDGDGEDDDDDDDFEGSDDDLEEDDDGFNEEDIDFSGDDEFAEPLPKSSGKKQKRKAADEEFDVLPRKKSKGSKGLSSIFASADDFSQIIDKTASSKLDIAGTQAVSNKDNAHVKQLKWEMERDKKMSARGGERKFNRKKFKPSGQKFKPSSQKFKGKPNKSSKNLSGQKTRMGTGKKRRK